MKKKLAGMFCVILACVTVLGACGLAETQENATGTAAPKVMVAEVDGEPIYYDDYYEQFVNMCEQAGISPDDEVNAEPMKETVIDSMVSETVMTKKLTEQGYMNLTQAQLAKADEYAKAEIDAYIAYYHLMEIEEKLGEGYTDQQYEAELENYRQELLAGAGMTWEGYVDSFKMSVAQEAAITDLTGDLDPTGEEIKAQYDSQVAAEKEMMEENPAMYESAMMYGYTAYYVPEGIRTVKQVLIQIDEKANQAINLLRENELGEQADDLLEMALTDIQQKADEVLAKLQSGEITFDQAIADYNEDEGMTDEGYAVSEGSTTYMEAFTAGAMALKSVGDISGLVATDYGYHIISYAGDVTPGAIDFETVKDEISETLKMQLQGEKWSALLEEWKTSSNVIYYKENY